MFKNSRRGRKGAKFQYFGELRDSVLARTQWRRAAAHRPELAEYKRISCAKGLRLIRTSES